MPTPDDVLDFFRRNAGLGEDPPGSNHNWITEWYGMDGAWCAMTVSRALLEAGFTDDGDTVVVPGVATSSRHGWAYVPALAASFANAGRFDLNWSPGDIIIWSWPESGDWVDPTYGYPGDHTSVLEAMLGDGSAASWDGNADDRIEEKRRSGSLIVGFCHPPYDAVGVEIIGPPAIVPTPDPGAIQPAPPPLPQEDDMPGWASYPVNPGEEVQISLPPMDGAVHFGPRYLSFFTSHGGPNDHAHVLIHLWGQSDPFGKDVLPGRNRNGVPVYPTCEGIGLFNDGNVQWAAQIEVDRPA